MATLTFWGVRGSIPSSGPETVRYGGNTSCVSIEHEKGVVILDAGSGLRKLGKHLLERGDLDKIKGAILLTHQHWDHIQGLPFFVPAYVPGNNFSIYGERKGRPLEEVLQDQMRAPYFPVRMEAFQATMDFAEVRPKESFDLGGSIRVTTHRLTHPNGAIGYLIDFDGYRVAYVTDHEHEAGSLAPAVLEMAKGVDVLIHDAQYNRDQLKGRKGWGHSAWEDVVDLAIEAEVGQLFLFHHDPESSDDELEARLHRARERFPPTALAQEGLSLAIT